MPKKREEYENIPIPELGGLTLAQFTEKLKEIEGYVDAARALLNFPLVRYTAEERKTNTANASFNREGEEDAYYSVLDGAEVAPGVIKDADLADKDDGSDPEVFEVPLQWARLAASKAARETGEKFIQLGNDLTDTGVSIGVVAKQLFYVLYGVLKPAANTNKKLKSALANAIDFFKRIARRKPEPKKEEPK